MKEYVILSGKGGTGKTSISAAFASIADAAVICDADVDAADMHLLTQPDICARNDFTGGHLAVIEEKSALAVGCVAACAVLEQYVRITALIPFSVRDVASVWTSALKRPSIFPVRKAVSGLSPLPGLAPWCMPDSV